MSKRWIARSGGGIPPHVWPLDDLIEHIESSDCPCRPTVVEGGVFVHHAADAREYGEPNMRPELLERPQ